MIPTQTFAAISPAEFGTIITILGGMLVGFYALIKFILSQSEKMQEADRKERQELSKAISNMADGMQAVAVSNDRIANESEKRNGHLAEISMSNKEQIIEAIHGLTIDKQTVHNQIVEHETVQHKEE